MPLSADEIRQAFFGEHGIAAENSEYLLRQFLPKDRDAYFDDIRSTQPACKWLFESEHGEEACRLLWEIFNTPKDLICAVVRKADDAYCGFCDLQSFAEQPVPELGIALIKDYQHQGIGFPALSMLMERYTQVTGCRTFISRVKPLNAPSIGLMRKLGGIPQGMASLPEIPSDFALAIDGNMPLPDNADALAAEFGASSPDELRNHMLLFQFNR